MERKKTEEKRMLIVDDAISNRSILKNLFANEYEIFEAEDGVEAMKLVEQYGEDGLIVLLDLRMPKMDGFEVLDRIRRDLRYSSVAVIVNTEYGDQETELRVLKAGADDFISKPYLSETVRQRVLHVEAKYQLQQVKMARALKQTSQQLQSLMSSVPGGIGIFELKDGVMGYRYFNDGLPAIMGYTREEYKEAVKETAMAVAYEEDLPNLMRVVEETVSQNRIDVSSTCRFRMVRKDGSLVWVFLSAAIIAIEGDTVVFSAVFSDINDFVIAQKKIEKHNQELQYHVEHDLLTGLFNREKFCKIAETFIKEHPDEQCVMIRIDIERFKVINELFGSDVGDQVLCKIANVLSVEIGNLGVYGRLEADHFAVCIPKQLIDYEGLLHLLEERFQTLALNYKINMYMGIYEIIDRELSTEQMCERANMALSSVKGRVLEKWAVYHERMRSDLVREQFITNEMNHALEDGQFTFYLQPIYDAVTEVPVSAEALVRWIHPVHGMVSPGEFIPLFERNGFIMKLDYYTWDNVCRYLSDAIKKGERVVPVSVNLSRINLFQSDLCEKILHMVDRYGLDHSLIKFEITESAYIDDSQQMAKVIETLQTNGFKVLMDDFGSGYSSLNMLKDSAVDILKIDMNFLERFGADNRGGNVLDGIVRMAKVLNMQVVAEGVETAEQLNFLKNTGCDWIQGYYFSKPLPLEEYRRLLKRFGARVAKDSEEHNAAGEGSRAVDNGIRMKEIKFTQESIHDEIARQKNYFDVVRLVDPSKTSVCDVCVGECEAHACYSVWGKNTRCNHCISLQALNEHTRYSKLEHSDAGIFFVIAQYIQVSGNDYVMEMVIQLQEDYVDHIFDREELLSKLNDLNQRLDIDELTGVYNRRYIEQNLRKYIQHAKDHEENLGMAMIDIDHLKEVNDTYGHVAGDAVIKRTARILQDNIAISKNDFVARYGGDEFLLVCKNIQAEVFARRMRELVEHIQDSVLVNEEKICLGISAGAVSLSEYPEYSQQELIEEADKRLYRSKKAGRGRVTAES